jgi:citrate synthase
MATKGTTSICGYDAVRIRIREKDLVNDLMGKLSFTEMFLLQTLGRSPTAMQVAIVDAVLVTIMEHGLVPSAIVTRLTLYGAPESFQGAIAAGLLGVGDRYAGTASECGALIERLLKVPDAERETVALDEIRSYRRRRRPLPGFGHPIHKQVDPRVERLIEVARSAGAKGESIEIVYLLERCLSQELGRKLPVNISAAIAAVLVEAGVPARIMRGVVLTARCAGLVGHLFEEMQNPAADAMWKAVESAVPYQAGD